MDTLVTFVMENATDLIAVVFAVMVVAQLIVNLTPTPKDNAVYERVYRVVEFLAGLVTTKAKEPTPTQAVKLVDRFDAAYDKGVRRPD